MNSLYKTILLALFVSLASVTLLGACGGSDDDSESGGGVADTSGDESGGGDSGSGSGSGDDGGSGDETDQMIVTFLSSECSKGPAGSVHPGENVTATFTYNTQINGTKTIKTVCPGVNYAPTSIDIVDGQGSETILVHEDCAGKTLTISIDPGQTTGSACTWNVSEELGLTF